jgi:hypothetical protein
MRFACWITKVTDTRPEWIILIAFPRQQWLRERASMLRLYVHCTIVLAVVSGVNIYCDKETSMSHAITPSVPIMRHVNKTYTLYSTASFVRLLMVWYILAESQVQKYGGLRFPAQRFCSTQRIELCCNFINSPTLH